MIKKKTFLTIAIVVMAVAASAVAGAGSIDIASFSNPSSGIGGPLFTINFANKTVDGGWDEVGLNLELMGVYGISNIAAGNIVGLNLSGISNGTSNVDIATADGNITMSVDGTGNVAVIDATGLVVTGTTKSSSTVTAPAFTANTGIFTGNGSGLILPNFWPVSKRCTPFYRNR